MKKLLTLIFIAALFGVSAPFSEAKTSAESEMIQQRRSSQKRVRQERREERRENQRYQRNRRDNRYYQNRRNNNRYQNRRYNSRTRTIYQTRYVRRGNRVYKETYRITYSPNGRTYTRLIRRVRAR